MIGRSKPLRFSSLYFRHASCRIAVIPLSPGIEPVKSATLLPKFINPSFRHLTTERNKRIQQNIVQLTTLQIHFAPTMTSQLICALPKLNHERVKAVNQRPRSQPLTNHRLIFSFPEPSGSEHSRSRRLLRKSESNLYYLDTTQRLVVTPSQWFSADASPKPAHF